MIADTIDHRANRYANFDRTWLSFFRVVRLNLPVNSSFSINRLILEDQAPQTALVNSFSLATLLRLFCKQFCDETRVSIDLFSHRDRIAAALTTNF